MIRRRKGLFARTGEGRYELHADDDLRAFLGRLGDELDELLSEHRDDPTLRPLFPSAYPDDVFRDAEYQVMRGDELQESRRAAAAVLRSAAERTDFTEDEVVQFMQAVNALRLVLGTRLDVDDDTEPPDLEALPRDDPSWWMWAVYQNLTVVLGETLRSLR